jgi:hypothetical protein
LLYSFCRIVGVGIFVPHLQQAIQTINNQGINMKTTTSRPILVHFMEACGKYEVLQFSIGAIAGTLAYVVAFNALHMHSFVQKSQWAAATAIPVAILIAGLLRAASCGWYVCKIKELDFYPGLQLQLLPASC